MSDTDTVLKVIPRLLATCALRDVGDPASGRRVSAHRARLLALLDERDPTMVGELAEHLGVTPLSSTMN